jgi:hypothetical protein
LSDSCIIDAWVKRIFSELTRLLSDEYGVKEMIPSKASVRENVRLADRLSSVFTLEILEICGSESVVSIDMVKVRA